MLSDSVFSEGVIFGSCAITHSTLMKPEATSSQAGEVTQLVEFPWRFLPSLLSELVHYRHLVLSAITQIGFMRHAFIHSKSSFVGAC